MHDGTDYERLVFSYSEKDYVTLSSSDTYTVLPTLNDEDDDETEPSQDVSLWGDFTLTRDSEAPPALITDFTAEATSDDHVIVK